MNQLFPPQFFVGNRQRLISMLAQDTLVVLTANGTLQRSADTTFPFAQDSNFWYLTGVDEADVILVMTSTEQYGILPKSNAVKDIFDGAVDSSCLTSQSGIDAFLSYEDGWKRLRSDLRRYNSVATIVPGEAYQAQYGFYSNPARIRLVQRLRRAKRGIIIQDVREQLAMLRTIKQPEELAAIRQAVGITTEAFDRVRTASNLATYSYEYELEAELSQLFRKAGARGHAYAPIVAAGKNATTLHYVNNNAPLSASELIVVDAGAEYASYAADITRTISVRQPSGRRRAVHDAVVAVQAEAQMLLKPGVMLREYEQKVTAKMAVALRDLGLVNTLTDWAAIRRYYPHATSHFLGLDVHDVGFYDKPLAEGMVLTCEPGIYIPEEGIGVRIEDDILITSEGFENLSGHCSYNAYAI